MNIFLALLKREILEHKNIWRVPLILLGIGVLVKLSLSFGNLSIDVNVPGPFQIDEGAIDAVLDSVIGKALNAMNFIIMLVMSVVAIFYALSCLYNERQDESVLFWRSLPISDTLTIASKLAIALLVIPLAIVVCQALMAVIFFTTDAVSYLGNFYGHSLLRLIQMVLWSLLPTIAWCVFCSEIAKKNPFLLAFAAPLTLVLVDWLFLSGVLSETFTINRLTGVSEHTIGLLISGLLFSALCISLAIAKRSQRI